MESILQKAPSLDQETSDSIHNQPSLIFESPQEKRKTAHTIIIAVGVGILILLIFFFYWRPQILAGQALEIERIEKLDWLEEELHQRAADYPEVGKILEDYQAWLTAGRPPRPSEETRPSSLGLASEETAPDQESLAENSEPDLTREPNTTP